MKLYASALPSPVSGKAASKAARALLAYAVRDYWGRDMPEMRVLPGGKPCFVDAPGMFFSISHSKLHILVGVSRHDIGVDIEDRREVRPGLAERLFSPEMRREFSFWEGWTGREAVFKLTGMGNLMDMELRREGDMALSPFEGVRCRFYHCVPGCTAAVAWREGDCCEDVTIVPAQDFLP